MASLKAWIKAARLRTLPLATTCVMIGGALGFRENIGASPVILGFAAFVVVKLQTLANFANDYGDFMKGTDNENRPDRALASGDITPEEMRAKMIFNAVVIFIAGCSTVYLAFKDTSIDWNALGIVRLGVASIVAAFKYTMGKSAYGYRGLGDLFVLIFFGYVGVLGIAFLMTQTFKIEWLLPSTFSGLMAVAVLNLNNMRDHVNDKGSGKNTLVVKMGFKSAKVYHTVVLLIAWACLMAFLYGCCNEQWYGAHWYALISLLTIKHLVFVWKTEDPKLLDPELKKIALIAFVTGMFMLMSVIH